MLMHLMQIGQATEHRIHLQVLAGVHLLYLCKYRYTTEKNSFTK